jgi:ankyrin repeat protein
MRLPWGSSGSLFRRGAPPNRPLSPGVMPSNNMEEWYEKEKLHFAADEGNLEEVKRLIENGYDVNAFDDGMSFTPLHYAVANEHYKVAECLLEAGANINANEEEKIGETPLGQVASNCTYEMAEFLINHGANPIIPGWMQLTALDRAKNRKKKEGKEVYGLLLKAAINKYHYKA